MSDALPLPQFTFLVGDPTITHEIACRLDTDDTYIADLRAPLLDAAVMMFRGEFTLNTKDFDPKFEPVTYGSSIMFSDWIDSLHSFHIDQLIFPTHYLADLWVRQYHSEGLRTWPQIIITNVSVPDIEYFISTFGADNCLAIQVAAHAGIPYNFGCRTILSPHSDPSKVVDDIRREFGLAPEPTSDVSAVASPSA